METQSQLVTPLPATGSRGSVLVVDDEPAIMRATARILQTGGYATVQAQDGENARKAMQTRRFDAIVSDICMPGLSGIELLRWARENDADMPVVFVTGSPAVQTAAEAIALGALRYLIKPVAGPDLLRNVDEVVTMGRLARIKREALKELGPAQTFLSSRAGKEASLTNALATLWMAYQPIVNWKTREVYGYEALVRTDDPAFPNPGALLNVAQSLGRTQEVSRSIRAATAHDMHGHSWKGALFVNLHPTDLLDDELYSPFAPLAPFARQIVLEITEREALDLTADVPVRAARLRALGYRLAIDDLGAGYSALNYFAELTPEVAKIDISLVRNIQAEPVKRKLVGSLVTLCQELGTLVVAEGVETAAEREALTGLGCDLLQGFLFAKPAPHFPPVKW